MAIYKRDVWRLALVMAGVIVLGWAPYVFAGKTLLASASDVPSIYVTGAGPRDPNVHTHRSLDPGAPGWQNDPWLALQHRIMFDERTLPMWDPYGGYGVPFTASMITQPFYPLTFIAALAPAPLTYNFLVLGRLFFLAWGCALFVRLFVGLAPAVAAGICAAFSAYFILYVDIVHVGVEIMLPWELIGVELVVRRSGTLPIAALAAAWGISLLGGMPESSGLAAFTIGVYAIFRIVVARADRQTPRRLAALVAGIAVGTAVAGIMLLPFLEYVKRDFDTHQGQIVGSIVGLQHDGDPRRGLLTEFAPLAFGPPYNNIVNHFAGWSGVRGSPGCFALFFAAIAAVTASVRFRRNELADRVALFLVVFGGLIEAKRFGAPIVDWIGTLPVLSLIEFPKYGEAVLAVMFACAAGFGVAAVMQERARAPVILSALVLVLGCLTGFYLTLPLPPTVVHAAFFYLALALAIAVVLAAAFVALARARTTTPDILAAGLATIALFEGMCACFAPLYYAIDKPSSGSRNPFAGAPYIAYLQRATAVDATRVVATGGDLFPNWSGAFGLYDPRYINAMSPDRFLPFIAAFVSRERAISDDRYDRFVGTKPIDYSDPLVDRWMALSSIAYVVSPTPLPPVPAPGSFLNDLWTQAGPTIPSALRPAVHLGSVSVGGVEENVLFEQPPFGDVFYASVVSPQHPWVAADLTLDPAVWQVKNCGGAVRFRLDATGPSGSVLRTAARTIDPKNTLADRRWNRLTMDLRPFVNQRIVLRFATDADGVPNGSCAAWAMWGEPRWTAALDAAPYRGPGRITLRRVPGINDAYVYRHDGALPRIALFHSARSAADGPDALRQLADPRFNVTKSVIVEGPLPALSDAPATGDQVTIITRRSQRVEAIVTTNSSAIIMQNDTWYPGWKATVDGKDAQIVRADYLFRGIIVPAGQHRLVIEYRSPVVSAGLATTGLGCLALFSLIAQPFVSRLSRRRAIPAYAVAVDEPTSAR